MNRSLIKNISYNTLANFLSISLGFILNILIARILQPRQMGYYSYFVWLIGFLSTIILLGVPNTLTKYISQYYSKEKEKIKDIFWSLAKIVIISFFITNFAVIVYLFFSDKSFHFLIYVFLGVTILVVNAIFRSIVVGLENFKAVALATLISFLLQIFLVIVVLRYIPLWQMMVWIILTCQIISTILFFIFIRKEIKFFLKPDKILSEEIYKVYKYLLYISLSMLINAIVWERSEIFFLKIFSVPEDLAFYSIAFTLAYLPNRILTFGNVLLPFMSRMYSEKEVPTLASYYTQITDVVSFFLIPVYVFIFAYSFVIIKFLYGVKYLPVVDIFKILIFASLISGIATVGSAYVQAIEKTDVIFKIGIFIAIVNILLDFLLIPKYKSVGAAYANSISQILGCFIGTTYILILHKAKFPFLKVVKYLLSSVVMLFILQILNLNQSLLTFVFYFFLFFLSYLCLNYKEVYRIINFYKTVR